MWTKLADKNFKVKNKLVIAGLTNANGVLLAENHAIDSHTNLSTQYGGTGTTTSPNAGQVLYSSSNCFAFFIISKKNPTDHKQI